MVLIVKWAPGLKNLWFNSMIVAKNARVTIVVCASVVCKPIEAITCQVIIKWTVYFHRTLVKSETCQWNWPRLMMWLFQCPIVEALSPGELPAWHLISPSWLHPASRDLWEGNKIDGLSNPICKLVWVFRNHLYGNLFCDSHYQVHIIQHGFNDDSL